MARDTGLEDSNSNLIFPTLPHESPDLDSLTPPTYPTKMAASDDADSLSSFNESAWDMIDERSAASEDEGNHEVSRIPTPVSELPEPVYMEPGSMAGDDTESEAPSNQEARFQNSRKDSSSDPPDTARPFQTAPKRDSILLEDQTSYIKFPEPEYDGHEVAVILKEFHGDDRTYQCDLSKYKSPANEEVFGTVRQQMARTGISPSSPFKVMYVGAGELKETIVNKLASALATSASSSFQSMTSSSRVTIVPISSFVDDSSPDVVLIDSMGIDMNIEVVKSAVQEGSNIKLIMTNKSTILSKHDESTGKHILSDNYDFPDIIVVYESQPQNTQASNSEKITRDVARDFASQHNIPVLSITYDSKWQNPFGYPVDRRLPHLAVEKFDTKTGQQDSLRRQAIDINTFIGIDSAQLSRSLSVLTPRQTKETPVDISTKIIEEPSFGPTLRKAKRTTMRSSVIWKLIRATLVMLVLIGAAILQRTIVEQFRTPQGQPVTSYRGTTAQALSRSNTLTATVSSVITSTVTTTLQPIDTSYERLLPSSWSSVASPQHTALNRTNKFQVKVVGDNHVLLFAPTTFATGKNQPKLFANTTRQDKLIPHELSLLHSDVFALQFPSEHAHGTITITLWTTTPARVYGTFDAELGSAWLKISGWQRAALAMKDQLTEDLSSVGSGLQDALAQSNGRVKHFFKDAVNAADNMIKEAEQLSLGSFFSAIQVSHLVVDQTKNLSSKLIQSIHEAAAAYNPGKFSDQHQSLVQELSTYSSRIASLFRSQAKSFATAASSITHLGQEIQSYRETHFVTEQRRLLQLYWNVFGMPERLKIQLRQKRQEMIDEDIWNPSKANARRLNAMKQKRQLRNQPGPKYTKR